MPDKTPYAGYEDRYIVSDKQLEHIGAWFRGFVQSFMVNGELHPMMAMKHTHSEKVSDICVKIASALKWKAGGINTAAAAGLLHDVGRFPQYKTYGTFTDHQSIDHGELGYTTLLNSPDWEPPDMEDYTRTAILQTVRYHNKMSIPDSVGHTAIPLLHLVRDADMLDIFRVVREYDAAGKMGELLPRLKGEYSLSDEITEELNRTGRISSKELRTFGDFYLMELHWVHDLNYKASVDILRNGPELDWILKRIKDSRGHSEVERILDHLSGR